MIGGGLWLAWLTNIADARGWHDLPFLIPSDGGAGRTLLATVAGAIITVAAIVFSLGAVTVQLAASQYSPRVVQGFLRDRFQQVVVGIVMGTFAFSITGLATIGSRGVDQVKSDWVSTVGVVLGVLSAIVIVAHIDRVTRRVRIDDTIRRIADETRHALEQASEPPSEADATESWQIAPDTRSEVIRSDERGYVQEIDVGAILDGLPSGGIGRLDVWIGSYVYEGRRLLTVWTDESAEDGHIDLREQIAVGDTRSIAGDPAHGIQQLVDIALRALSPGVNDPATAVDVVRSLAPCVRAAFMAGAGSSVFTGSANRRLVAPHRLSPAGYVRMAFEPIVQFSDDQPLVLAAVADIVRALIDDLADDGHEVSSLEGIASAVEKEAGEVAEPAPADRAPGEHRIH